MQGILLSNKQWTKVELNAGTTYLIPQTFGASYYYSKTPQTSVDNLDKNKDIVSFSETLSFEEKTQISLYLLSTKDNSKIALEDIFCNI